jgi:signal transduction histidine kinase
MKAKSKTLPTSLRYTLGITLTLGLTLVIFILVMSPPASDLQAMVIFLFITATVSGIIGYIAYRLGWMTQVKTIRWTLLISYVISSVLTFFNVWLTARLMFASQHDLLLATVLLIFAGGMAMVLGYFFSTAITDRIELLEQAAHSLAEGDLNSRVSMTGNDEVASLGTTFNQMAEQLKLATDRQQELKQLRSDLIAWVSHDLQTPLTSIQAILEALSDKILDDPDQEKRYLETAQRNVQTLSALIDDLFQMAKIDAGGLPIDRSPNSLSDLISDTLESFSHIARQSELSIMGNVDANVDPVYMDVQLIGRVLNNLVSNAIHFTPEGGSISITAKRKGEQVNIIVRDTGEGIPPEDLPHVFESFYRGEKSRSRATGGAGLGLAIAHGIIQAHGGDIRIESKLGKGTTFTITL